MIIASTRKRREAKSNDGIMKRSKRFEEHFAGVATKIDRSLAIKKLISIATRRLR